MPSTKRELEADETSADTPAPATKKRATAEKAVASITGICSLSKKQFGDKIKTALRLEKYEAQRMMISMNMDLDFFRNFFDTAETEGIKITPKEYDDQTPVIVAQLSNTAAGEIFGVSKIKNGNRYSTLHLAGLVVILYPVEKKAQAWLTV